MLRVRWLHRQNARPDAHARAFDICAVDDACAIACTDVDANACAVGDVCAIARADDDASTLDRMRLSP